MELKDERASPFLVREKNHFKERGKGTGEKEREGRERLS